MGSLANERGVGVLIGVWGCFPRRHEGHEEWLGVWDVSHEDTKGHEEGAGLWDVSHEDAMGHKEGFGMCPTKTRRGTKKGIC